MRRLRPERPAAELAAADAAEQPQAPWPSPQPPLVTPTGSNSPPGAFVNAENSESTLAEGLPQSGHGDGSSNVSMDRIRSNRFRQVVQAYS